jgi:hypothetical protein
MKKKGSAVHINERTIKNLLVMLVLAVGCGACDSVNDLTTIDFSSTINFPVEIRETSTGTNVQYDTSVVLDAAAADPEIQKYSGNIERIEVEDISFSITEFSSGAAGEVYLTNGSLGFGKKMASMPASSCQVDNLPVSHWAGTGSFDIAACDNTLSEIANALSSDRSVKIFLQGTLSKAPVSFKLHINLELKVTARTL